MNLYELTMREVYDSFAQEVDPAELLSQSRNELAARLQVEQGIKQEDAYYAVDQMRAYALQKIQEGDAVQTMEDTK